MHMFVCRFSVFAKLQSDVNEGGTLRSLLWSAVYEVFHFASDSAVVGRFEQFLCVFSVVLISRCFLCAHMKFI